MGIPESARVPLMNRLKIRTPLRFGMSGADVEDMQFVLEELNDEYGFCKRRMFKQIENKTYFDTVTLEMVIALQAFWNYPTTGVVDLSTLDLMEWKVYNKAANFKLKEARLAREAEAAHLEKWRKQINKLFKDGRFGK